MKMQLASLFRQLDRHIFVIPAAFLIHGENMDKRRVEFLMTLFMATCRSNQKSPDFSMFLFSSILSKAKGH